MKLPGSPRRWAWALGWLVLLWVSAWLAGDKLLTTENSVFVSVNQERIRAALDDTPADIPIIIAFGNSLLRAATPARSDASSVLGELGTWVRISRPGGTWHDFEDILEWIGQQDRRPDLIVLQSEIFVDFPDRRVRRPGLTSDIFTALDYRIRYLGRVLPPAARSLRSPTEILREREHTFQLTYTCSPMSLDQARQIRSAYRSYYERNIPIAPSALEFIRSADTIADRVIVFDLGRAQELSDVASDTRGLWSASLSNALSERGIRLQPVDPQLGKEYFCDYRHLNESGRAITEQLIATHIQAVLQ